MYYVPGFVANFEDIKMNKMPCLPSESLLNVSVSDTGM